MKPFTGLGRNSKIRIPEIREPENEEDDYG